ncbi:DUF5610 domain-containing protein [Neptunomonas sp. XY-337]|uniref:DUF5610 domain-containing protein n=1 Tax=Neptunomonas sp. XY-337 TaxID=2561897 RepID=UPI0010AAE46A|nr:DUF5610 domain-containing protein [Neptunomonas sp. XY-337]
MISTIYSNTSYSSQSLSSTFEEARSGGKSPEAASNDLLLNRLAQNIPGMSAGDMKAMNANDFTPEKVASRISDFVAQGLETARRNGRSEDDIQKMHAAAVEGVKKGFAEAREILDGLGALSEGIAANIDTTEEKTMDALAGLLTPPSEAPSTNSYTRVSAAERYSQAETLSLKVRTQDGDEVSINFAQASQYQAAFAAETDGNGNSAALFNVSRSEASQYQFSVQGDLDNDEIDALQNLIKDVNEIANEFFDGDMQKAFEMASEFEMDKTELASMNLKLTQSEQYSSVAKYRGVEGLGNASPQPDKLLGNMAQNMQNAITKPELGFLDNIKNVADEILSNLVEQDSRYRGADNDQKSLFDANLDSMRSILDGLQTAFVQEES